MKILIIGGNSNVGRHLTPYLSEYAEVVTAGRENCIIQSNKWYNIPAEKGYYDAVINAVADFGGNEDEDMIRAEKTNALDMLKLCQWAVNREVKHLIHISSIFSQIEKDSPNFNIYALSKRHGEELAEFYCKKGGLPLTIIRPSRIIGDDDSFRKHQPFFYEMIDRAERGYEIIIYGKNDPERNYIHIDDLTRIISEVIKQKVYGGYDCCFPDNTTFCKIADAAFSAFDQKAKIYFKNNECDIPDNVFEIDLSLYSKVQFLPQIDIEAGIKKIADYRKGNKT